MAELHLVTNFVHRIRNVESTAFLGDARIEDHVVHKISYLLHRLGHVLPEYGVAEFIYLLLGQRPYRGHSLGRIPRALLPQCIHHVKQPSEGLHLFFSAMHIHS